MEVQRTRSTAAVVERMLRELKSFPQVEAAAVDSMTPYTNNGWQTAVEPDGTRVRVTVDQASDDFARVMKIRILKGRWFSAEDDAQNYRPVVIDADAAGAMFGGKEAIGRRFSGKLFPSDEKKLTEYRVVGVISNFRQDGELSSNDRKMVFLRTSLLRPESPDASRIVVRVRPGTTAALEARLNDHLRRAGGASFAIKRMEDLRRMSLRMRLVPVAILTIIALFLILMVALGLTGVLWQTITRRMREIGLRRAVGASGAGVRLQVLGEVAVLSTLSVIAGAVVILQLPFLGAFRVVTPGEFTAGFLAAIVTIYSITLLCGAYPGWLASTIEPADALRYE